MGRIEGKPPFDLVPLHSLPIETWKGRAVFHPMAFGPPDGAYWDERDYPPILDSWEEGDPPKGTAYDVGVVLRWWEDDIHPGIKRVEFVTDSGGTLNYSASTLYAPIISDLEKLAALGKN